MLNEKVLERIRTRPWAHIGRGNLKLPKDIGIFSLPCIVTCPNHTMCRDTCYGRKAERLYPYARATRIRNLELSRMLTFVPDTINLIKYFGITKFRIHEAGDFYDAEYAYKWDEIIYSLPDVLFYCYTKSPFRPTEYKNFNIVESILPDGSLNYGDKDYVLDKWAKFGYPICQQKVCTGCSICQTEKHVLFYKH